MSGSSVNPLFQPSPAQAPRRLVRVGVALALALALLFIVAGVIRNTERPLVEGDLAFLGINTHLALEGRLSVGAYSRYYWRHPGPIYFYAQVPLYWLSGQHPNSLAWTALLINLGCAWLMLSRLRRKGGFGLFAAGAALLLVYLLRTEPSLPNPWNPYVPVLALGALTVACAELAASTRLGALPLVVLLASFVTQTHVAYVPCAGALVLAGLALHLWRRRQGDAPAARDRTRDRLHLLLSGVVLAAAWALPVLENLRGDPGNLKFLIHVIRHREATLALDALRGFVHYMSALPMGRLQTPSWQGAPFRFEWLAFALTAAQFLLLWPASRWAGARGRSFHQALCLVSLAGSATAAFSVSRITDEVLPHLVFWLPVLSVTNLTAIAAVVACLAWDQLRTRDRLPAGRLVRALGAWLPAILILAVAADTFPGLAAAQRRAGGQSAEVKTMLADFQAYLDQRGIRRPVFHIEHGAWAFAGGVILELSRAGRDVAVERRWEYMYTAAFAPVGSEDARFDLLYAPDEEAGLRLEYERVAGAGPITIHRVLPLEGVRRLTEPGRILGATGTRGDPARIVDGRAAADGSRWDSEEALVLGGPQASVTLAVPPGATGVALSADGNDSYRLECSADGSAFELAGIVPVQPGEGLRTRERHFKAMAGCRRLRVSADAGDGMYSIAEVTFLSATVSRGPR